MKNTKGIFFGGFILIVIAMLIVGLNLQTPVTVQQQTFQTPTGTTTATVKACDTSSPITISSVCQLSTVQGNKTISSPDCTHGGISINGVCPTSVTYLPSTTIINPPTTPTAPTTTSAETIQVSSSVSVIDNSGTTTSLESHSLFLPLASLFPTLDLTAVQGTNTNINQGELKVSIVLLASPNENIVGNGTLWVTINGQQLHPQGLKWAVNQMTDSNGKAVANIATPNGIITQYALDIEQNAGLITNPTNQINFTISNVLVQNGKGQSYNNPALQTLFTTILEYDPNKIIQQNSDGSLVRVYPNDDTFTISATGTLYHPNNINPNQCHSAGCASGVQAANAIVAVLSSIPAGSASVYQENANGIEKLIGTTSDVGTSGSQSITNIPRDADIKITVGGTTHIFHTGITHESHSYACTPIVCTFS